MRRPSRVLEVLPLVNGLFAHMDYTFWDFTSQELDILMQSRFGQRPVAPLIDIIQGPPSDPFAPRQQLSDAQLTQLASIILHTFKNKWDRLGAIHSLEYDVLKNYLDEYTEVLRDDTDASTLRETERADEDSEVSRLSTTSGTEGEQANVSSNESTNRRSDDFSSEFARVSKDSQVRVDDLEESKVRSESTSEAKVEEKADAIIPSKGVFVEVLKDTWVEVKDENKLYLSKVLKAGDKYTVPEGEGKIFSVGKYDGVNVYVNGVLTNVVKPNKKTNISLDKFLNSVQ